jgi:hypothetical protein
MNFDIEVLFSSIDKNAYQLKHVIIHIIWSVYYLIVELRVIVMLS